MDWQKDLDALSLFIGARKLEPEDILSIDLSEIKVEGCKSYKKNLLNCAYKQAKGNKAQIVKQVEVAMTVQAVAEFKARAEVLLVVQK